MLLCHKIRNVISRFKFMYKNNIFLPSLTQCKIEVHSRRKITRLSGIAKPLNTLWLHVSEVGTYLWKPFHLIRWIFVFLCSAVYEKDKASQKSPLPPSLYFQGGISHPSKAVCHLTVWWQIHYSKVFTMEAAY